MAAADRRKEGDGSGRVIGKFWNWEIGKFNSQLITPQFRRFRIQSANLRRMFFNSKISQFLCKKLSVLFRDGLLAENDNHPFMAYNYLQIAFVSLVD